MTIVPGPDCACEDSLVATKESGNWIVPAEQAIMKWNTVFEFLVIVLGILIIEDHNDELIYTPELGF